MVNRKSNKLNKRESNILINSAKIDHTLKQGVKDSFVQMTCKKIKRLYCVKESEKLRE